MYSFGKSSSPHGVRNGEVDHEGDLHHVAPVPLVDVLIPDEDYDCQEEEEDADAEGNRIEVGEEVNVGLAWPWARVVVAGIEGELEHTVCYIVVVEVSIAHAEFVIVPREVAKVISSLMLVGNVVAVKTTIMCDFVGAVMKLRVQVQKICN